MNKNETPLIPQLDEKELSVGEMGEKQPELLELNPIKNEVVDVAEKITEIDSKIEREQSALSAVQESLGLPTSDTSKSIEDLKNKRAKLQENLPEADNKEKQTSDRKIEAREEEQEKQERARIQKDLHNIEANIMRLAGILQKREESRLNPLATREDLLKIAGGARALVDTVRGENVNFQEMQAAIRSMRAGLENYGTYRSTGPVREDTENLRGVASFMLNARENAQSLVSGLVQGGREESGEVISETRVLIGTLEKAAVFTRRKIAALSQYQGRR